MMLDAAKWLLFCLGFGNQAGVPVPVVPHAGAGAMGGNATSACR